MIWKSCSTRIQQRSTHNHLKMDADALSENCVLFRIPDDGQSTEHCNKNRNVTSPELCKAYGRYNLISTNKYTHLDKLEN
jgi:hypothetical protein